MSSATPSKRAQQRGEQLPHRQHTFTHSAARQVLGLYSPLEGVHGRHLAATCCGVLKGLPNALCPSDHLPVGAALRLLGPAAAGGDDVLEKGA